MENGKNLVIVACVLIIGALGFLFALKYWRDRRAVSIRDAESTGVADPVLSSV